MFGVSWSKNKVKYTRYFMHQRAMTLFVARLRGILEISSIVVLPSCVHNAETKVG